MQFRRLAIRTGANPFAAEAPRELSGLAAGIPFLLAAGTPWLAFQSQAVVAGFVLTVLAFFTVQLPVTAALLASPADKDAELSVSPRVYLALLAVWTLTAWLASAAHT